MRIMPLVCGAVLSLGLAAALSAQNAGAPPMKLKEGDKAPDFTLPDQNNKMVHLGDFHGKKTVILAFFIKASTSG
jgi:cytochrome oxidase Cu insertion factor (SCO1/SenC/PrrC family)